MKTISDADWEIIKSAAQTAIDGTLSRSKHKEWSDAMARVEKYDITGESDVAGSSMGSAHGGLIKRDGYVVVWNVRNSAGEYKLVRDPRTGCLSIAEIVSL